LPSILLDLDEGLLYLLDIERTMTPGPSGARQRRVPLIRALMREALGARAQARGEELPEAILFEREDS
jgi:hypothetical protein